MSSKNDLRVYWPRIKRALSDRPQTSAQIASQVGLPSGKVAKILTLAEGEGWVGVYLDFYGPELKWMRLRYHNKIRRPAANWQPDEIDDVFNSFQEQALKLSRSRAARTINYGEMNAPDHPRCVFINKVTQRFQTGTGE